jgi:hypothetical protein
MFRHDFGHVTTCHGHVYLSTYHDYSRAVSCALWKTCLTPVPIPICYRLAILSKARSAKTVGWTRVPYLLHAIWRGGQSTGNGIAGGESWTLY